MFELIDYCFSLNIIGTQESNDGCKSFATKENDSIGNNLLDTKESEVIIETKKVTLDLTGDTVVPSY